MVVAIEESQDLSLMALECLQERLEAHEAIILQRKLSTSHDQALKFEFTFTRGCGGNHGCYQGHNHPESEETRNK